MFPLCIRPCAGSWGHNGEGEEAAASALMELTAVVERDFNQKNKAIKCKLAVIISAHTEEVFNALSAVNRLI